MLTWPKNVQFYFIFFGLVHLVGGLINGIYDADRFPTATTTSVVKNFTFSYDWMTHGDLYIVWKLLLALQIIGITLLAIEGASKILSVFKK